MVERFDDRAGERPDAQRASDCLAGGGEMGALMRSMDWSQTPLGPLEGWPQSLRSAISILLASRAQIVLFWGPQLAALYNDAYAPTFGSKHPWALGKPARECWAEIWEDTLRELFEGVLRSGESFNADEHPFFLERHGYLEETYYDVSYDPVRAEDGGVGGIFCIVSDATGRVLERRRWHTLRDLSLRSLSEARSDKEACRVAAETIGGNNWDVPFALIYLIDADRTTARLAAAAGIEQGTPNSPVEVPLGVAADRGVWPLDEVASQGRPKLIDATDIDGLPCGAWDEPPRSALVLPLAAPGQGSPAGLLVAAVSPRRLLDDVYRYFFDTMAGHISTAVAHARAYAAERHRAEALAEIDRAKTLFFSNVSHEFRTPLTLMLGPAEDALADAAEPLGEGQRRRIEVVHRSAIRLLKLVNTLLDFSRIEAGRVEAVYEPTDLAAYTAELASMFRSAVERAGLRFAVDCAPLREEVFVDRDMWEKVVFNLLSNALKFTFEGAVEVRLRDAGASAELEVRDTGVGIPEAEIPRLFERFHRVEGVRGRTHEGTGIGLALARELVRLHGGEVRVESAPGRGTAFTVSVPFGRAHLPADRVRGASALAPTRIGANAYVEEALRWLPDTCPSADGVDLVEHRDALDARFLAPNVVSDASGKARVLVVDDNADVRDYIRGLLEPSYEVDGAADGESALEVARSRPPDLVLSDVMMPGLDGFGLLRALRTDSRLRTLPVVLLSARAGEDARLEGLDAGADDYLVKPFGARELLARVRVHVEMARAREEAARRERQLREEADAARAEAVEANRAKDEFLATVSHELRTPLNAMLGWTTLLRSGSLDEDVARRALDTIDRNARSQAQLIEDILDVTRIVSGKVRLDVRHLELVPVIEEAVDVVRPAADAKQIRLVTTLDPAAGLVSGDAERLKQVVWNLLSNAVKFTPKEGRVHVELKRVNSHVELVVGDTGIGIAPEFLPYVFERFRQAESAAALRQKGLGLGLAIVKHLVELHGGSISVESAGEGLGTTFTLCLPVAAVTARSTQADHAHPRLGGAIRLGPDDLPDLGGRRILVVDDEPDARDMLAVVLSGCGAEVRSVGSAHEAVAELPAWRPDLLISDIGMPGEDGYELIRRVRALEREAGGRIPAVALTAFARVEDRLRVLASGYQMHVAKPVEPAELVMVVASLVGRGGPDPNVTRAATPDPSG